VTPPLCFEGRRELADLVVAAAFVALASTRSLVYGNRRLVHRGAARAQLPDKVATTQRVADPIAPGAKRRR